MREIPQHFLSIPYNSNINPDNTSHDFINLSEGSNCLIYTYALLRYFSFDPPILWSSELWSDTKYTEKIHDYKEFDMMFFGNNDKDAYWWHLALCIGEGKIIHLSKEVGFPEIIDPQELIDRGSYKYIQGIKRLKQN